LELIARTGRLPAGNIDLIAHMLHAALSEAALHVARATDQQAALAAGQAAVDLLLDRLLTPPPTATP
jgi:hypothetical protein